MSSGMSASYIEVNLRSLLSWRKEKENSGETEQLLSSLICRMAYSILKVACMWPEHHRCIGVEFQRHIRAMMLGLGAHYNFTRSLLLLNMAR